jgi:hypothetical protein
MKVACFNQNSHLLILAYNLWSESFVFFFALGANQHIIDEHYDELVQIFHKHLVHQIHKVGQDFY